MHVNEAKAIFCDRDGTLIRDAGYVRDPAQIELVPGAAAALSKLRERGFLLVIVSNHSGIGRGFVTKEEADRVHHRFQELLERHNAKPDATYVCPHLPSDDCSCRKPAAGLLLQAANDLSINLSKSWMIGDQPTDIEAGHRAGCHTAYITPEKAPATWQRVVWRILNSPEVDQK
jgi:D-glycero-D-manno-heptose 1,7-bisphosphate phosphatase